MLKSNSVTDLFFGKGGTAFYKAVAPRNVYEASRLVQKLGEVLFFEKLSAADLPSYNYGSYFARTLITLTPCFTESTLEQECAAFIASEVDYLKQRLHMVLLCLKFIPQILIDLYTFYPRFNLKFEEIEFIYLDFGSETPKVIDSLLKELLLRGAPLNEPFTSISVLGTREDVVFPPIVPFKEKWSDYYAFIGVYFVGYERSPVFTEILMEYFKARPGIPTTEGTNEFLKVNMEVTDQRLAFAFVSSHMFKGVSKVVVCFCMSNLKVYEDYSTGKLQIYQDPFRSYRENNQDKALKE